MPRKIELDESEEVPTPPVEKKGLFGKKKEPEKESQVPESQVPVKVVTFEEYLINLIDARFNVLDAKIDRILLEAGVTL